jgi:hypothetical protein
MKKIIIALFVTAISSTTFAAQENPQNDKVTRAFSNAFAGAKNVHWIDMKEDGLFHASFELNNEKYDVFFDEEGNELATTRYITEKQLPMAVAKQLLVKYAGYAVSPAIIEYAAQGETGYYITLNSEKNTLTV